MLEVAREATQVTVTAVDTVGQKERWDQGHTHAGQRPGGQASVTAHGVRTESGGGETGREEAENSVLWW